MTFVLLEWKKEEISDWSMWVCSKYKVSHAAIFKDSRFFFFLCQKWILPLKKKKEMEITIGKRAKRKVKDFQRSATF